MKRSAAIALSGLVWVASCATDPSTDPDTGPVDMRAALARDLGLDEAQLDQRLDAEAVAAQLAPTLQARLGDAYAGAWMSDDGTQLVVGLTDPNRIEEVRATGAEPRLLRHSLVELEARKAALDLAGRVDPSIHAWYVDVTDNAIVVEADDPRSPAVAAFLGGLRDYTVIGGGERPRPLADVSGGDEYILGGRILCSVGFAVDGGFVSAGHCGTPGTPTAGSNWVDQGTVRASIFPGNDWSWIQLNTQWASLNAVGNHAGGSVDVAGSQVAPVGSSVCRSGRTSGWHCGVIQAQNVTVNYAAGPVYGTTQTSACAEGGDSGGSFISGNQAQGVTSGGSGNCTSGGTTFFQPINPILSTYGLTLKTSANTRQLASGFDGKCIDVPSSSFIDGAHLQMYDCNATGAQRWTFVNGTVRAGGKCMDVAWANPASGTSVQIANCNGNVAQQFTLTAAGDLVSVLANKCVDIAGWNSSNGAPLIIWPCTGGSNQKWH